METVIGVLLIIMGIFLIISVLMQSSKDHRLSGSIAGGAETFFGKQKGKTLDALFNKLTTIVTIIFVVLVLALYVMQPSLEELMAQNPTQSEQPADTNGDNANETGYNTYANGDNADANGDNTGANADNGENADNTDTADNTTSDNGAENATDTADAE